MDPFWSLVSYRAVSIFVAPLCNSCINITFKSQSSVSLKDKYPAIFEKPRSLFDITYRCSDVFSKSSNIPLTTCIKKYSICCMRENIFYPFPKAATLLNKPLGFSNITRCLSVRETDANVMLVHEQQENLRGNTTFNPGTVSAV